MPTGKHGSSEVVISYDDAPGGSLRNMTAYVLTIGGMKREAITQQTNPFGTTFEENTPTGMNKSLDIPITGLFDDTAVLGPHVVFGDPDDGPQDATRTFVFVAGNSKTFTAETRLISYEVIGKNGNLTEFAAVIRTTGSYAWT